MSEDHTEFDAPEERERPRRALPWWRYRRERPAGPGRGPLLALERRFTREWADVYARQEREREELAGECRGEELRARSDTMRVMHRAERSALAAAHSAEAKERWQALRRRRRQPGPLVGPVPSPGRSSARWLFSSWCCWLADLEEGLSPGLSSVLCLPLGGRRRVGSFPRGAAGSLTRGGPPPGETRDRRR